VGAPGRFERWGRNTGQSVKGGAGIEGRAVATRVAVTIAFANGLWFIWSNRFLPLSDYPDWIYQGLLFSKLLAGRLPHLYALKRYPVPNAAIVTAALGLLNLLMSPEAAGKVVLTGAIGTFLFGSVYLLESLPRASGNPFVLVPALLMFNTHFFGGELSFLAGLSLFFIYSGILIRRLDAYDSLSPRFFLGWSLLFFFTHFETYIFAVLITAILSFQRCDKRRARALIIAFLPTACLSVWYVAARLVTHDLGSGSFWVPWTLHLVAGRYLGAFFLFPEFLPWLSIQHPVMRLAAILDLAAAAFIGMMWAFCAAAWVRGRRENASVLAAAAVFAVGFPVAGFELAGTYDPGGRFLYPAAWLAMCWLGAGARVRESKLLARSATVGLVGLLAAQCAFLDVYAAGVSYHLAGVYRQLRDAPTRAEFCEIYDSYRKDEEPKPHRTGLDRFLTNHSTVVRLPYYLYAERGETAPIFQTGIFSYNGPGNNEDLCL